MRLSFLSVVVAIAVAWSGFAGAVAAEACPMQAMTMATHARADGAPITEMGAMAGCEEKAVQKAPVKLPTKGMNGCAMWLACSASPTITPSFESVTLRNQIVVIDQPLIAEGAPARSPLGEHWRPPRTI
jgi:hypothetical protein